MCRLLHADAVRHLVIKPSSFAPFFQADIARLKAVVFDEPLTWMCLKELETISQDVLDRLMCHAKLFKAGQPDA